MGMEEEREREHARTCGNLFSSTRPKEKKFATDKFIIFEIYEAREKYQDVRVISDTSFYVCCGYLFSHINLLLFLTKTFQLVYDGRR